MTKGAVHVDPYTSLQFVLPVTLSHSSIFFGRVDLRPWFIVWGSWHRRHSSWAELGCEIRRGSVGLWPCRRTPLHRCVWRWTATSTVAVVVERSLPEDSRYKVSCPAAPGPQVPHLTKLQDHPDAETPDTEYLWFCIYCAMIESRNALGSAQSWTRHLRIGRLRSNRIGSNYSNSNRPYITFHELGLLKQGVHFGW